MLDDRKAQTGAAGRLGAALVHAVEPLKHAGLAVLRDADAVILDLKVGAAVAAHAAAQLYMAARAVVAYGVVAQVLGQLAQLVAAALHRGGPGVILQRHIGAAGVDRHVLGRLLDQRGQIHRGHLSHRLAAAAGLGAVQLTQLQNVADQRDHPLRLLVDARSEGRHIGGLCHAGLDQLGIAGNARQRGL